MTNFYEILPMTLTEELEYILPPTLSKSNMIFYNGNSNPVQSVSDFCKSPIGYTATWVSEDDKQKCILHNKCWIFQYTVKNITVEFFGYDLENIISYCKTNNTF
jgi:hypothetical protein